MNTAKQVEDYQKLGRDEKQALYQQRLQDRGVTDIAKYEGRRAEAVARGKAQERQASKEFVGSYDTLQQSIERDRKIADYKNFAEGFRPINDALVKAGDLAVKLGGAGLAGEAYKKFAPPGSEFYQRGTLEEKVKKSVGV